MRTCANCGKEIPDNRMACSRKCAGALSGGRPPKPKQDIEPKLSPQGYYYITHTMIDKKERDRLFPGKRTILYHRYIMTKAVNRPLLDSEVVMHVNGDKTDNRIENLAIGSSKENTRQHYDARIDATRWRDLSLALLWLVKATG